MSSPLITDFLHQAGRAAVIAGGLGTELQRHGADLNDPLWSAKCLLSCPHLIRQVHLDYLENGADIIITASYQATIQGFKAKGFSDEEGEALLRRSVEIAREARDLYYQRCAESSSDNGDDSRILKQRPILIAGSVGSYGAYLADGSEFSGNYGDAIKSETLKDFHRRKVQILADSGVDLLAFEAVPNKLEAQAYADLLEEENIITPAWFAFTSKDGNNVVSGDSIEECGSIAESCDKVVAVGINCTPPRFIHDLILLLKKVTAKPIVIYPNSGETYDAIRKEWGQNSGVTDEDFVSYVDKWCESGASLVGGCCRTTPDTIRGIYKILSSGQSPTFSAK
uniref:Selenocysteine methyltransferase n=1 Tax=Astragalus bisulcatus TaxID=20406 RepID=SMTA_ASTBI|nr:RecName: Full=Selenocysteine methyltransferase; Short=SECYS-MT; Short=SECYS-methyltransferase [Astragalus bisulcatus]WBT04608.1 SMT [synthetic construct]CAA10368.1 selenocysteine methyltransferase [Astragalus bisulcatus]